MLSKQSMPCGIITKQRQATLIASRHSEPGLHEALPEVAVEHNMPHWSIV
jgi:hypothetical protein